MRHRFSSERLWLSPCRPPYQPHKRTDGEDRNREPGDMILVTDIAITDAIDAAKPSLTTVTFPL